MPCALKMFRTRETAFPRISRDGPEIYRVRTAEWNTPLRKDSSLAVSPWIKGAQSCLSLAFPHQIFLEENRRNKIGNLRYTFKTMWIPKSNPNKRFQFLRTKTRVCYTFQRVLYELICGFAVHATAWDCVFPSTTWHHDNQVIIHYCDPLWKFRHIYTSFSTSTRGQRKNRETKHVEPDTDEERRRSKGWREEKRFFERERERISRGLTLLALGIIRPAKEIGIARNSWEGVEFHMKYTWHLLPSPAGPLQRRKRIINRSPPSAPFRPFSLSLSLSFLFPSLFFFLHITRLLTLRLFGREARRLRKVPGEKRRRGWGRKENAEGPRPHRPLQSGL